MEIQHISKFLKSHAPLIILISYGLFLILYKNAGSFAGDEATYAQIAKESLSNHNFLTLSLNNHVWFEKPPLLIWLTALAFKFFGISEVSARLFPGVFSVLSAVTLYFLGKELFERKLFGFVAGFVFLTTPIILFYSRSNMTDIPVGFFICLSVLALWKIIKGDNRWWLVFGTACGLAVMMKSVVGLFPFLLLPLVIFWKRGDVLRNNFFFWGTGLFFLISAPWHIYMTLKFGRQFLREYFGFQIFERVSQSIFNVPWQGDANVAYLEIFWQRSGLWFYILLMLLLAILVTLLQRFYFSQFGKQNTLLQWIMIHKKSFLFLSYWLAVVLLPFIIAKTKLPNYMLLAYYPFSLLVGGCLGYLVQEKKRLALFALTVFSLLNFLPLFQLRLSTFGEAQFLSSKPGEHFLQLHWSVLPLIAIAFLILLFFASIPSAQKHKIFFCQAMLFVMLTANMIIPFNPERNVFVKKIGEDLTSASLGQPVTLYYNVAPEFYSFKPVITFYLPLKSTVVSKEGIRVAILPKSILSFSSWCYSDRALASSEEMKLAVFSSSQGVVHKCAVSP